MALHLQTKINIEAAPQAVWAVLSDLPSYPSWKPFIREASGTLAAGERLDIELQPAQEERFTGLPVPFLSRGLRRGTLPGFERMNEAVKERAEAQTARVAA